MASLQAIRSVSGRVPQTKAFRFGVRPSRATAQDVSLRRVQLGKSDLEVTEVCLGCMMFGTRNTEDEAHTILSAAFDAGVNFLDTAEIYPVAPSEKTVGLSSKYVGSWLKKSGIKREDVVIATKVSGYGTAERIGYVAAARTDPPSPQKELRLDARSIEDAVDCELRRLGVDYIDLMQTHWPDRYVPNFGSVFYKPENERESTSFEEQVTAMADMIRKGKIRHWGLSNESSYGTTMICMAADRLSCPRPISIQNSFSLIDRRFETELAEVCTERHLGIPLLPWSPGAGGILSGKYLNGNRPERARMSLLGDRYHRFLSGRMEKAVEAYVKVAKDFGVTPMQLAYLFCKSRFFVTSTIIGATSLGQLEEDLEAFGRELPQEALDAISKIHSENPNPQNVYT